MQSGQTGAGNGQPDVVFTIDGVEYTSEERRRTAGALLGLAGVDAAEHDLARVVGTGIENRFADDEEVQLTPGAQFVSIFTGPTPVV